MHCSAALLLVLLTPPPDDAVAFNIEPYLQRPDRDAITVMWETTRPTGAEIRYGTAPELDLLSVETEVRSVHEVRLTGLLPRTRYYYQVRCGDLKSSLASFRTPPGPGERCRLVVYGDSRSFPDRHQRVAELAEQFEPDLVLHTGDQVTRGTQRPTWKAQFFDPAARLFSKVPVITSLGNHEENAGNYFEYLSLPGNERYFSLDCGDLHLVVLDSNAWGKSARDSDQFAWLQEDLTKPLATRWTAVAFHHPLFSAHDKRAIIPARWDWCPAFEDLGVDLVLTGHDHFYYRSWPVGRLGAQSSRGITHITTAGGGAPLYRMKERSYTAVERPSHHVTVLDLDGDAIRGKVIDLAGTVLDQYEIKKDPTPSDEFCAYEVYELEHSIRRELESRPPTVVAASDKSVMVQQELRLTHRFRVPVSARLTWDDLESSGPDGRTPVVLAPGEPLILPIAREVTLDCISPHAETNRVDRLPRMHLEFLDERFRNRDINFAPLKIWRDLTVQSPALPIQLDVNALFEAMANVQRSYHLVRSDGYGAARVPTELRLGHTPDRLVAMITVRDAQTNLVAGQEAKVERSAAELVKGQHVRVVLSNGKQTYGFAVSLDGRRADSNVDELDWTAHIRCSSDACNIAMVLPRRLLENGEEPRINVVHSDPTREVESCLTPTFDVGTDPDRIPDFRFGDRSTDRFARLVLE